MNAWLNSPTHRDNILRAQYTKIGVSMAEVDSRRIVTTVFTNQIFYKLDINFVSKDEKKRSKKMKNKSK